MLRSAAPRRSPGTPRIGLFGLLGWGNLGNDGSLETVVDLIRRRHPDASLSCMCAGPERVRSRYGIASVRLNWYRFEYQRASSPLGLIGKAAGKVVDAARTVAWVRQQDVVVVPGMGVLEATLPLRPWGWPYSLFLLAAAGRLTGTKVALVGVGASVVRRRSTRWLLVSAARMAHYRSYRDVLSRDAMREMGVDVARDPVHPDVVFALPTPGARPTADRSVGVGVMAYHGSNDDRARADEIHHAYLAAMTEFVRRLVDEGREVRLFTGDKSDSAVVEEILADLRTRFRHADRPPRVAVAPVTTMSELVQQMSGVGVVVATRHHNVLCALKLAKPTLSVSYAEKSEVLMADMGLGEFHQRAHSVDVDRLVEQFRRLEGDREQLTAMLRDRSRARLQEVERQFAAFLDAVVEAPSPSDSTRSLR